MDETEKKVKEKKGTKEKEIKKDKEEKKIVEKKETKTDKPKKTEAIVNAYNLPISTKQSSAICRFIKNKEIEKAIENLEQVIKYKKAIPMKGEIAHKKGMASGKYPVRASGYFIKLLESLLANSHVNNLENPVVFKAIANIGVRPSGKFGSVRRKRTHVTLISKEKSVKK